MDQQKITNDLSKEDKIKIYKILLLTYSKRLSNYQDQIQNIYLNNIISSIKDGVDDNVLNEHVTSHHQFIDTLIKSDESFEFLKSLELLENKTTNKEYEINKGNGDYANNSNNNAQINSDILNNEQNVNNQIGRRRIFNSYIMGLTERYHMFLLIKIFFVLFLFEASTKVYFIVLGMFILYNRGFFGFLTDNFNFLSSNESIEQILRRMSESRNLNNTEVNPNNQENNDINDIEEKKNEKDQENDQEKNQENKANELNSLLSHIEQENQKITDDKLNTENYIFSMLHIGSSEEQQTSETVYNNNNWDKDNENESNGKIERFNKTDDTNVINTEKKIKVESINFYNDKNKYNEDLEKKYKNNIYPFNKITKSCDEIEPKITEKSDEVHNISYKNGNLNKNNDYEIQKNVIDSHMYNENTIDEKQKESFDNFISQENTEHIFNNIKDSNSEERKILESCLRNRKNKNNLNDATNNLNNILNNGMTDQNIGLNLGGSIYNSDTSKSNCSNASSNKREHPIQKKENEKENVKENVKASNIEITRRKPTKLEKYIYQSVVMFFMTFLPWWAPDIAYLEE